MQSKLAVLAAATLSLASPSTLLGQGPVAQHEAQVQQFKPDHGLSATNANDVRRFVYEWFTHFEHASTAAYYLGHLDDKNMSLTFPGTPALTSHNDFAKWYENLLAQTLWNFHEVSTIQVKKISPRIFVVSFIVDWYGEVKPGSDQLAAWQSRKDSRLYHYRLRQTWTVKDAERLVIEKLVVTPADTTETALP